jgi:predicted nuclease with TOPRIM domain
MISSTMLLTTNIAQLAAKKATLHEILRKYEDDFYKLHQRQVSSFDDIEPFENVYLQYKEIEIAIDIKKKQEHSVEEEAISFWGWKRHLF